MFMWVKVTSTNTILFMLCNVFVIPVTVEREHSRLAMQCCISRKKKKPWSSRKHKSKNLRILFENGEFWGVKMSTSLLIISVLSVYRTFPVSHDEVPQTTCQDTADLFRSRFPWQPFLSDWQGFSKRETECNSGVMIYNRALTHWY